MPRRARNRRATRRPLQPYQTKHGHQRKAPRAWRHLLLRPSVPLGLLALVVAALVVPPKVDADVRSRQQQAGMQIVQMKNRELTNPVCLRSEAYG